MRARTIAGILSFVIALAHVSGNPTATRTLLATATAVPLVGPGPSTPTPTASSVPAPSGPEYFIQVQNGQFVNGCNYFKIAGWNQWEVVEAAAGAPSLSGASIPIGMTGPQLVRTLLQEGAKVGFNVMRTWAQSVDPQYALQPQPGVFSEAVFQGLDYLLDEARQAGIKLILAFVSNWTPAGGVPEYLKWANQTDQVQFFINPSIIKTYQNTVSTIINRRNTINGRLYRDDPVIAAWDLLNEPRCPGCPNGTVANWYEQQAAFLRSLDPNHLITTGEEGFYGCCNNPANPGVPSSDWAAQEGQDFIADNSGADISFATMHSWPDNWQDVSEQFQQRWIASHVNDAGTVLKKPIILEEWGKWVNLTAGATVADRNSFMGAVYDQVKTLMSQPNSPLQGSLFWQWYLQGQEAAPTEGGGGGLFGIYETDAAFQSIKQNVAFIQSLNGPVPGCSLAAHKAADVPPSNACQSTWVNNTPGTGMEGPACNININECVRGTANCAPNASCIDTPTAYQCQCYYGFTGDGKTCTPNQAELNSLRSLYWSEPKGLSCKAGVPVPWPKYAPGWIYDPMKSFAFFDPANHGTLGSHTNVTLDQCMIACQMADTCESFVYNDVLMQCFLNRGQCPVYNYCQGSETQCVSTNDRGGQFTFGCGFWVSYYRLDSNAAANCQGFTPAAASVGTPNPAALNAWNQWKATNPTAPIRYTPPTIPGAEPAAVQPAAAGR